MLFSWVVQLPGAAGRVNCPGWLICLLPIICCVGCPEGCWPIIWLDCWPPPCIIIGCCCCDIMGWCWDIIGCCWFGKRCCGCCWACGPCCCCWPAGPMNWLLGIWPPWDGIICPNVYEKKSLLYYVGPKKHTCIWGCLYYLNICFFQYRSIRTRAPTLTISPLLIRVNNGLEVKGYKLGQRS